ncbi:KAP family P-loop domain protein [Nautilia profundicola AmH]|uniref:KAP family P-loop domain protein n=1 Tax=Nautilia profundicola (strain ATCC BAA-1463 / DSM 18972 / AmH) TaxID=598659 RepID=B9LAE5_NAUPA|nr:KAP family P-loop domain protein [Nautilia profundicola]ACM93292.1 KAP family P-loop domain protein [Nautilia profundicola AmH]
MEKEFDVCDKNYNQNIENYLLQYCNYENSLNFAVLIKGKWGSGKTFFIKNFIENKKKEIKFIYVSLFGLSNIDEVSEKIFEAFHPILSSKQMKFFSAVAQGAIKFGLRVDLENLISLDKVFKQELEKYVDIKIDENVLIKNIFSWKKTNKNDEIINKNKIVFVFDDLERSLIDTKQSLALINDFVEQKDLKVILLCNEEEIEDKKIYNKFKEKVIGKEFEISFDFKEVYFSFIEIVEGENNKKFLKKYHLLIKDIFNKLKINNLRILQQTFVEFELFANNISKKYLDNEEFMKVLILHFFAFVMYYKKSNSLEELQKIESGFYKEGEENRSIFQKKLNISFGILFGISFWKKFLKEGYLNNLELNKYVENTVFFKSESKPDWVKLWHYWELDEEEFDNLLSKIKKQFFNCDIKFENFYIFLHVIGIIIFFMENEIINDINEKYIIKQIYKCIEKFKKNNYWTEKKFDIWNNPTGLGYLSENSELFDKIIDIFINEINEIERNKKNKQKIKDLENIVLNLKENKKEKVFQVLKKYESDSFFDLFSENQIDSLIKLPSNSLFLLNHIIYKRYISNYLDKNLCKYYLKELSFLRNFQDKITEHNITKLINFKQLAFKTLLENIRNAIEKLEKCKNEIS